MMEWENTPHPAGRVTAADTHTIIIMLSFTGMDELEMKMALFGLDSATAPYS